MEFPPIVWPSFIKFIKNWMFANFIIRPYFDHEFSLQEFIEASKHAVEVCSIFYIPGNKFTLFLDFNYISYNFIFT